MAKKQKRPQRPSRPRREVPSSCFFCKEKKEPDYRDIQGLEKFITDRKKILGRSRTGICAKHQRSLSRAIKRARHLALLPFSASAR